MVGRFADGQPMEWFDMLAEEEAGEGISRTGVQRRSAHIQMPQAHFRVHSKEHPTKQLQEQTEKTGEESAELRAFQRKRFRRPRGYIRIKG
jgi:hypothetical protein